MAVIFTATLSSNDGGNDGLTMRNVCTITGGALDQIRVTFKSAAAAVLKTDHCAIGIATGTNANTTATPVELKFSGVSGFTISIGASATSDWVNFNGFTSSDKLVPIMDIAATGGSGNAFVASGPNMFFKSGASYNSTDGSTGFTNAGAYAFVSSIETQSVAGAGPIGKIYIARQAITRASYW